MIKFAVEKRFTTDIAFTAEIDCAEDTPKSWKLRLAVLWAIENKANLTRANLSWADLSEANLTRADLTWANLTEANLTRAGLTWANLTEANLTRANLTEANLTEANLTEANLTWAKNINPAYLRYIKHDIWSVCMYAPKEIPNLLKALKNGKVDGSQYEGKCRCLCGTLEGKGPALPIRDARSAAERWFMGIKEGDTPENNPVSKITVEWIEELLKLQESA